MTRYYSNLARRDLIPFREIARRLGISRNAGRRYQFPRRWRPEKEVIELIVMGE